MEKNYSLLFKESINNPTEFWQQQAKHIYWHSKPTKILHKNPNGTYQWFIDGSLNMSYLCIDVHIKNGRGNDTAIIYDSPVTNTIEYITYNTLKIEVDKVAAGLINIDCKMGDCIIIYMPMIPQAIYSMLACAKLGIIHSVVFGGFAPHELAIRIEDATPKAIITASYGIEIEKKIAYKPLVDEAIKKSAFKPTHVIVYQRPNLLANINSPVDIDYTDFVVHNKQVDPIMVPSTHPLYILYTSGTTGKPKGIVRDTGGYAVALKFSMDYIYNTPANHVFWAASDVGWVVGHSYIVYGPLLQGCTTILFEGKPIKTPNPATFWRIIEQHKVHTMFTAPTAIRAIKKEDPEGKLINTHNVTSLQNLFLAGERCDPTTYLWIKEKLQKPVIDHWWQTESGWPMLGIMKGVEEIEPQIGSAGKPICGYEISILNDDGQEVADNMEGNVAIKLPLPPGCLTTIWKNEHQFIDSYLKHYDGYYMTGDGGKKINQFFYIMGRIDDVINVAGHRLSTGEMEELIAQHRCIAECAVVGIADELRGQRPIALVVLKDGYSIAETDLEQELVQLIRDQIGAIAYFKNALIVKRLPKTRSGKILRKTIRLLADGIPFTIPSTIDDPLIIEEIKQKLVELK